ncbi:hypothetical protein [Methylobacterium sp. ID0610]|uniref:hypothetical protein n=1 Tax=Methylobacterium carpenticola TaxID=3344827 RepID=UPI0036B50E01
MNRSIALQAGLALLIGLLLVGFASAGSLVPVLTAGAIVAAAAALAALRGGAQPVPVPVRARRPRR